MVLEEDIIKSEVIVELWAWTWIFTQEIFKHDLAGKKVFIIEKNKDFYKILISKYPKYSDYIYNVDLLDIESLLEKHNVYKIDLIISWLPFKSLPKSVFIFIIDNLIAKYFDKNSVFVQFSYFRSFKKTLEKYFSEVLVEKCWLNIPPAYVFRCKNFKN